MKRWFGASCILGISLGHVIDFFVVEFIQDYKRKRHDKINELLENEPENAQDGTDETFRVLKNETWDNMMNSVREDLMQVIYVQKM